MTDEITWVPFCEMEETAVSRDEEKHHKAVKRWRANNPEKVKLMRSTYIEKHRAKCLVTSRRYRRKLKLIVVNHYGGKCECCGEDRLGFMTIDHVNGGGTKHRKSLGAKGNGSAFYKWLRENNFPSGYRILCFNCNCGISACGVCPHKSEPQ